MAKHPLDRKGGKASTSEEKPTTKRDPDDADEMKRRQVQKQKLSEESKDRHQQGFQDNASRKETTPQTPSSSDQHMVKVFTRKASWRGRKRAEG